jgi:hypothetical protein
LKAVANGMRAARAQGRGQTLKSRGRLMQCMQEGFRNLQFTGVVVQRKMRRCRGA